MWYKWSMSNMNCCIIKGWCNLLLLCPFNPWPKFCTKYCLSFAIGWKNMIKSQQRLTGLWSNVERSTDVVPFKWLMIGMCCKLYFYNLQPECEMHSDPSSKYSGSYYKFEQHSQNIPHMLAANWQNASSLPFESVVFHI